MHFSLETSQLLLGGNVVVVVVVVVALAVVVVVGLYVGQGGVGQADCGLVGLMGVGVIRSNDVRRLGTTGGMYGDGVVSKK